MGTTKNFLTAEAEKTARALLLSDEKILPIQKWGDGETLFVSQEKRLLTAVEFFVTDGGLQFFIGTKK